jgi:hypothetical protein
VELLLVERRVSHQRSVSIRILGTSQPIQLLIHTHTNNQPKLNVKKTKSSVLK